jgi:hypothetical protein
MASGQSHTTSSLESAPGVENARSRLYITVLAKARATQSCRQDGRTSMNFLSPREQETAARRNIVELAKGTSIPHPSEPTIVRDINGAELPVDLDPMTRLRNCLILIAFYTGAQTIRIRRHARRTVAEYTGAPHHVENVVMPARAHAGITMSLLNMMDGNILNNSRLTISGAVLLKLGLGPEKQNYRAIVSMYVDNDAFGIKIDLQRE